MAPVTTGIFSVASRRAAARNCPGNDCHRRDTVATGDDKGEAVRRSSIGGGHVELALSPDGIQVKVAQHVHADREIGYARIGELRVASQDFLLVLFVDHVRMDPSNFAKALAGQRRFPIRVRIKLEALLDEIH